MEKKVNKLSQQESVDVGKSRKQKHKEYNEKRLMLWELWFYYRIGAEDHMKRWSIALNNWPLHVGGIYLHLTQA